MRTRNWLKLNRELHNLTRKELASQCDVSFAAIQAIEQGTNKGTNKTWQILEKFFIKNYNFIADPDGMIFDLKEWNKYVSDSKIVYVSYVMNKDNNFIFYDWSFSKPDMKFIRTYIKDAIKLFEEQNKEV